MSTDELAAVFAAHRPRLVRVAYAVLGSLVDAEDVVADCWSRLVEADAREPVRDVLGWATVAVSRAAIDVLRSARVRRESYVGPWLPEPQIRDTGVGPVDPADRVTLEETVGYALLVALEQLSPAERTAWVLHDLFEVPFADVARAVGRSPAAVRQLAHRARRHVAAGRPRVRVDATDHERTVRAFLQAAAGGDLGGLVALLDPDAVLTSDGGGVVSAARRPVHGPDRVARFVMGVARRDGARAQPAVVNGLAGLTLHQEATLVGVVSFAVADGRVRRVDIVRAPAKLPQGTQASRLSTGPRGSDYRGGSGGDQLRP